MDVKHEMFAVLTKASQECGWRGRGPKSDTHFYCEFCKAESEDSSFEGMGHHSSCLMHKIESVLSKARGAA